VINVFRICQGGGWAWVRLGKIKCAAKALACVSACSSFNFAKCLHFFYHLSVRLLSVVSSFRVSANVLGLCEGGELEVQMFNLAEMLIRIPMLKFSTNAPLLQNPC